MSPHRLPHPFARIALALLVAAALAPAPGARAAEGDPIVHLTWRAPYGMPGAVTTLPATCPDSTHRDTLYLSCEFTQPETTFVGVGGELGVYIMQPGDTLGSFWDMGRGGANHGGFTAYFQNDGSVPGHSPWAGGATGMVSFERRPTAARIKFGEVMAIDAGTPIEPGRIYTLGRFMFCGKRSGLSGCDRAVCIEWRKGEFVFARGRSKFAGFHDVFASRGVGSGSCVSPSPSPRATWQGAPSSPYHIDVTSADTVRVERH